MVRNCILLLTNPVVMVAQIFIAVSGKMIAGMILLIWVLLLIQRGMNPIHLLTPPVIFSFRPTDFPDNGGKDIYFSFLSDTTWNTPVCLDPPVNSKFDDFGIVTDTLMNEGYFSSNRDKSVDIYSFQNYFSAGTLH